MSSIKNKHAQKCNIIIRLIAHKNSNYNVVIFKVNLHENKSR